MQKPLGFNELLIMTAFVIALKAFFVWKLLDGRKQIRHYVQGRDAEIFVGVYLEKLRAHGADVLHDAQCGNFNIDHIVIMPNGIYAIETKAYSKPVHGGKIVFTGSAISINGSEPRNNPVQQARGNAAWLHKFIANVGEVLGKKIFVQAVVICPNWYVDSSTAPNNRGDAWVMNHKEFCKKVADPSNQQRFTENEVSTLSKYLKKELQRTAAGK